MMHKILWMGVLMTATILGYGQKTVRGTVVETDPKTGNKGLPYAQVKWSGTQTGTLTDETGGFKIETVSATPYLIISYAGYKSDTLHIKDPDVFQYIVLKKGIELGETVIRKRKKSAEISKMSPKLTVELGRQELQKAACCNLSESFETTPSIDVSFTDALTGTRQIRMLGLDGIYTQFTREMMPGIRGMSSPYGMNFIPGTWVQSIQLTKGVGSVINGFESMAGQINIELKKPEEKEKFFLDGYVNQAARTEINAGRNFKIKENLYTGLMVHASARPIYTDMNEDGFADNPTGQQVTLLNRWKYFNNKGWEGMAGFQLLYDQRFGGQNTFLDNRKSPNAYGLDILNKSAEIWTKNGYVFKDKPYQSFGTQVSFKWHELNSDYGNSNQTFSYQSDPMIYRASTQYSGAQYSGYANLLFASILGTTEHKYTTGLSFQYDRFEEKVNRFNEKYTSLRNEWVQGAFVEYSYIPEDDFTLVTGMRADYNNIYGWFFTPRIHGRYMFNHDYTVLRFSGGRGQRTAAIFAENQKLFGSGRMVQIIPSNLEGAYGLNPEVSWNYGLSLSHEFKVVHRPTTFHLDYFRTDFVNQVIADYDFSSTSVMFYNLSGRSFANSFQTMLETEPITRFDVRLAYRWFDVRTEQRSGLLEKALLSPHRAFINLAYTTRSKWNFDLTAQWYDRSRMPLTNGSPESYQQPSYSKSFILINAQVAKELKKNFSVYVGGENVTNYRQNNPIVSAENPFNPYFDTTMIWGPVFGGMVYAGFRWNIEKDLPECESKKNE